MADCVPKGRSDTIEAITFSSKPFAFGDMPSHHLKVREPEPVLRILRSVQ